MHDARIRIVADVGGTNTRIALYDPAADEYRQLASYENGEHPGIEDIISRWLAALGELPPTLCCIAAAAPPGGDRVTIINANWSFSCGELAQQFGFMQVSWLNDFQANAYSLPCLKETELELLHAGEAPSGASLATVGPGTGLGGACLEWIDNAPRARACEPGHMGLSPATELELEVFRALLPRYGEIYAERLVSGPGLLLLYQTLADIRGQTAAAPSSAAVSDAASARQDDLCVLALQTFYGLLGSVCGDFALANGSYGGLYLAGGIVPQMLEFLRSSSFMHRFRDKGAMGSHLEAVPLYVITAAQPGLIGAAHAPIQSTPPAKLRPGHR